MNDTAPHYLLTTETGWDCGANGDSPIFVDQGGVTNLRSAPAKIGAVPAELLGSWRFVLRPVDGSAIVEAADVEPDAWGERLELLTVVRALESLDQPSWVTIVGCSRYIEQGVSYGVAEWRENDWRWEFFGQMVPVRDSDLWQRMDRALQFHRVDCGNRRFDSAHDALAGHNWTRSSKYQNCLHRMLSLDRLKHWPQRLMACGAAVSREMGDALERFRGRVCTP